MDYTHFHHSTLLASIVPRNFRQYHEPIIYLPQNSHHTYLLWHFHSHSEIYRHATFHRSVYYDTIHHNRALPWTPSTDSLYLPQNSHHTYLSWHFHSHSEIYCHATSIIIFMKYITFVILPLHDHVVDIVFVAKSACIIFYTCHS